MLTPDDLIPMLEKQLLLHRSLVTLSEKKTNVIVENDIDSLNKIIKDEKSHIQAIAKLESERLEQMEDAAEKSLSEIGTSLNKENEQKLLLLKEQLSEEVTKLKKQNELNQQLIEQSLHFVNISIDLLLPQADSMNYGKQGEEEGEVERLSIFDSKA